MTTKKTKNVSPTKEEKDEALRAFMYGDIPRPLISMDERYPDLEESDNSVISTGINAVISPTTKEEVQKQETPPKNEQEEEAQPKPVSLPDGKQTPAHRVSSKQRRLSLMSTAPSFFLCQRLITQSPCSSASHYATNLTRWHEGLEASV